MTMSDILKLQNGSDVRGVAVEGVEGESINLTPEICRQIGCAYASWLEKNRELRFVTLESVLDEILVFQDQN